MDNRSLFSQEAWNERDATHRYFLADTEDPIVRLIRRYVPPGPGDALEIGCWPGSILGNFGLMGYTMHGVDLSPSLDAMRSFLQDRHLPCGTFHHMDFFDFYKEATKRKTKYGVVASFGFVEHFKEFERVFFLHCKLVKDNGYVVMTFPNFLGTLQFGLHALLDRRCFKTHSVEAMHIEPYVKIAETCNFDVLFAGYFGGFAFWRANLPFEDAVHQSLYQGIRELALCHGKDMSDSMTWSPFGGIIARKSPLGC